MTHDIRGHVNDNGEAGGSSGDRTHGNWAFRRNISVTGYGVDT